MLILRDMWQTVNRGAGHKVQDSSKIPSPNRHERVKFNYRTSFAGISLILAPIKILSNSFVVHLILFILTALNVYYESIRKYIHLL